MNRNFSWRPLVNQLTGGGAAPGHTAAWRSDPRAVARLVLGALLLANLLALLFILKPWGGSAQDLDRELGELQSRIQRQQASLARVRAIAAKVEKGRNEQDEFLAKYFMDRRTTSSTILSEIVKTAREAGLKPKEHSFLFEPVEGSETLSMMTIAATYEGSYGHLVQFVNLVDRSPRFLIIESIQATPQREAGILNVRFKINTFVRDTGRHPAPPSAPEAATTAELRPWEVRP